MGLRQRRSKLKVLSNIGAGRDIRFSFYLPLRLVTALSPHIGYEAATRIATEAHVSGQSVYDLVLRKNLLSQQDLDRILSPENLIRPSVVRRDDQA